MKKNSFKKCFKQHKCTLSCEEYKKLEELKKSWNEGSFPKTQITLEKHVEAIKDWDKHLQKQLLLL